MYTYSDTFGVAFAYRIKFTCISVCGMSLSHRLSGNNPSTPHSTDLKCPLKVCIPFSAKFLWCVPDGTNSYFLPFHVIFSFYASDILLSIIYISVMMPHYFSLLSKVWYVYIIYF